MAEMFTRDELSGIIACVDKEYSDLWQMYNRQGIDLTDTPIQRHLFSIMKKAASLAKELELGSIIYADTDSVKIKLSSKYGVCWTLWSCPPEESGEYIVTIIGFRKSTTLYYDKELNSWYDYNDELKVPYHVTAWMPLPEAYGGKWYAE